MKSKLLIPVLALGVFGIITTEMGIIGVLPQISEKFGITASTAGWLVGVFALVVAVTGPFTTLITSGINRRTVLLVAIAVFAVSNVVYATTSSFEVMFAFRIIPAVVHPVFFAVALASAVRLVSPEQATAAVTKVFAGVTVGFAFGVPLTSYLAENFSVSTAFVFGAVVNVLAFLGIVVLLPSAPVTQRLSYGAQVGILRRPRVWLTILSVTFVFAAMFSVYGYFAEYLGEVTGMSGSWISAMLLAFGGRDDLRQLRLRGSARQGGGAHGCGFSLAVHRRLRDALSGGPVLRRDGCSRVGLGCSAFRWTGGFAELDGARRSRRA